MYDFRLPEIPQTTPFHIQESERFHEAFKTIKPGKGRLEIEGAGITNSPSYVHNHRDSRDRLHSRISPAQEFPQVLVRASHGGRTSRLGEIGRRLLCRELGETGFTEKGGEERADIHK